MYADETAVRALCRNRLSALSLTEIQASAAIADMEIDMAISKNFWWPNDQYGNVLNSPPPAAITTLSSLKTAALIEMQTYAQNEAGQMVANPYGRSLERRGDAILKGILSRDLDVPELEQASDIATTQARREMKEVRALIGGPGGLLARETQERY